MDLPPISDAKRRRLASLSTSRGVIAALAIDQRKSLRRMIAEAAGVPLGHIPATRLAEFKAAVTHILTGSTSAVLLDPEYGLEAARLRDSKCGLLLAYEMDGYENPRPHRMLALLQHYSVRRLRDAGAQGIKILLHYAPGDLASANDEKCALIERIGSECHALDLPFFLEPVVYDPDGLDPRSLEFARQKPDLVLETIREFSKDIYRVDVLKVEFPVIAAYVEGSAVFTGQYAHTMEQAMAAYRAADAAAGKPYIYLSAGVKRSEFLESLRLAHRAGARYSGVLCGRATWQRGVRQYAQSDFDVAQLEAWLQTKGLENIHAINQILESATPWYDWFQPIAA